LLACRSREAGRRGSRVLYGEGGSADEVTASKFPEESKEIVEEGRYSLKQIFNLDETWVFWKLCSINAISPSVTFLWNTTVTKIKKYLYFCQLT
jgi:hypothetical protein